MSLDERGSLDSHRTSRIDRQAIGVDLGVLAIAVAALNHHAITLRRYRFRWEFWLLAAIGAILLYDQGAMLFGYVHY